MATLRPSGNCVLCWSRIKHENCKKKRTKKKDKALARMRHEIGLVIEKLETMKNCRPFAKKASAGVLRKWNSQMRVSKTSVKVERTGGEHSPRSASRGACREIQHTFRGHEPLKNCNFSNKRLVQDVSLRQMPRTMVNLALHNHATCYEYQNCFQILVITIRSDKATLGVNTSRSFQSFS